MIKAAIIILIALTTFAEASDRNQQWLRAVQLTRAGELWTPADLTGLALWLDASDDSTIQTTGSSITNWLDKSGNENHAANTTTNTSPIVSANTLNDNQLAYFDGNDYLTLTDSQSSTQYFFIAVTKRYSTGHSIMPIGGTTSSGAYPFLLRSSDQRTFATALDGYKGYSADSSTNYTIVASQAESSSRTTVSAWKNATLITPIETVAFSYNTSGWITIGRRDALYHTGDIAEIVVSSVVLLTSDRQKLEGYLAHKWGLAGNLPALHPYKDAPPTK